MRSIRSFLVTITLIASGNALAMFTNHSSKEINLKLIYVGPQFSGKSENLQYVYDKTDPASKGKMISIATGTENTMFFDLVPKGLGEIRGYRVRLHLYSLAGKEEHAASTQLLLKNADGIVFVADAQKERIEANIEAWDTVQTAIRAQGRDWSKFPKVIQLNKHRLPNALPLAELKRALGLLAEPTVLADTRDGSGVFDTLKAGVKELLLGLKDGRVKEWEPTPAERASGDQMTSRVQVMSHYDEFFGEGTREFGPLQPSAKLAPVYIMLYPPTKARPYVTYATFGLSTLPQPAGGPEPRIELIAYSAKEDEQVLDRLAAVAMMIRSASPAETAFKTFDTVDVGDAGKPDNQFALVPVEEDAAFTRFPDEKRKLQNLLFTRAVGATKDSEARVTFLKLLPLTSDEAKFAAARTTRVLLKKFVGRPKHFGWNRTAQDSVLGSHPRE